jgi:hypothetical protein
MYSYKESPHSKLSFLLGCFPGRKSKMAVVVTKGILYNPVHLFLVVSVEVTRV